MQGKAGDHTPRCSAPELTEFQQHSYAIGPGHAGGSGLVPEPELQSDSSHSARWQLTGPGAHVVCSKWFHAGKYSPAALGTGSKGSRDGP